MARYKEYDYNQTRLLPVSLQHQLMPGTLEFAIHELLESGDRIGNRETQY